jgi:multidrug efflux pump subunit AcrB
MKPEGKEYESPKKALFKKWWFWASIVFGVVFNLLGWVSGNTVLIGTGNFLLFMVLMALLNTFVFRDMIAHFQQKALPKIMDRYENLLRWVLKGKRPVWLLVSLFLLFPIAAGLLVVRGNKSTFFPAATLILSMYI